MIRRWRSAATGWCGCGRDISNLLGRRSRHERPVPIFGRARPSPGPSRRHPGVLPRYIGLLPLVFALRELRGGLRGFYVFISCIALGVAAIAGVGSTAASLIDGLAREGRVILGGDVAFSLIHREA